jgi:hypothetical protein
MSIQLIGANYIERVGIVAARHVPSAAHLAIRRGTEPLSLRLATLRPPKFEIRAHFFADLYHDDDGRGRHERHDRVVRFGR